jgi:hypothetical protein
MGALSESGERRFESEERPAADAYVRRAFGSVPDALGPLTDASCN